MLGKNSVQSIFQLEHVFDADFHIAGLPFSTAQHLMDHDVGIRQCEPFTLCAGAQQHRAHAGRLPDAIRVYVAGHVLHRVVNCQSRRHAAAGRVDVEMHVLLRIGHLEKQKLRDDDVGNAVVNGRAEKDDAVNE